MTCTAADYEAAAAAISHATDLDAQTRKRHGSKSYAALLPCDEFHDRCMKLARAIAFERVNSAYRLIRVSSGETTQPDREGT